MFWWFERDGIYTHYEVEVRADGVYELRFMTPEGVERVERFRDTGALAERQRALDAEFKAKGWTGPHGSLR